MTAMMLPACCIWQVHSAAITDTTADAAGCINIIVLNLTTTECSIVHWVAANKTHFSGFAAVLNISHDAYA